MTTENTKLNLIRLLGESGALFFAEGLTLKDGRPSPYFVNLGAFRTGPLVLELGRGLAGMLHEQGLAGRVDVIIGPSYKGSALAVATSIALWQDFGLDVAFDYDRKEAKTHGEATKTAALFVTGALSDGSRVYVVDDVATSMGTKLELIEKLDNEKSGRGIDLEILGVGICLDREQTTAVYDESGAVVPGRAGRDARADFSQKTGVAVHSLLGISEVVDVLFRDGTPVLVDGERRSISPELKARFDEYLGVYGA